MNYKTTRSPNICKEGKQSYRVRFMKSGTRVSKSFNRYREAVQFRNELKENN